MDPKRYEMNLCLGLKHEALLLKPLNGDTLKHFAFTIFSNIKKFPTLSSD